MPQDPREGLPPELARQLDRLERLGNAEAELNRDERAGQRRAVIIRGTEGHRRHARDLRRRREQTRGRKLGLLLLCLAPLLTLCYALAGYSGRGTTALVCLLLATLATAGAIAVLYVSRQRRDDGAPPRR